MCLHPDEPPHTRLRLLYLSRTIRHDHNWSLLHPSISADAFGHGFDLMLWPSLLTEFCTVRHAPLLLGTIPASCLSLPEARL